MPFLRFSRDKRGYEHTYLVHAASRRGKPARARVLYWYRTPPGVKVGRAPFDVEVRKTLEAHYPGVSFDWKAFESTPMPPPEPEYWRERRRAERAAKQARQQEDIQAPEPETAPQGDEPSYFEPRVRSEDLAAASEEPTESHLTVHAAPANTVEAVATGQTETPVAPLGPPRLERRRRRRGGRRRRGRLAATAPGVPGAATDAPAAPASENVDRQVESLPEVDDSGGE